MGIFAKLIKSATGELDWMDATIVADDEFRFWVEIVGREAFSGPIDYPMLLLSFYGQTRFLIHSRNPSMAEANFHLRQLMDHVTGRGCPGIC
jgi:hypothetical protein